jgi:hypothetical protein
MTKIINYGLREEDGSLSPAADDVIEIGATVLEEFRLKH